MVSKSRIRSLGARIDALMLKAKKQHLGLTESRELEAAIAEKTRLVRKRKRQQQEEVKAQR